MTLAEVADELYGLTPADFTAARDERARQVRAAGQRDEAAAIKKLARPTTSAWLVNQLARTAQGPMARLYELGDELQEAQRTLAGDRLRELSVQRRQVINDLLPTASDLATRADQPASAAVLGEVQATLEAALADADARAAVRSGLLTKALAYAGLGEVDLSAALAVAAQPRSARSAKVAEADKGADRTRPGAKGEQAADTPRTGADAALQSAQEAVDEAAAASAAAERAVTGVDEQRQFLRRRISHLERELAEARATDAQFGREAKQAVRSRDGAARRLASAERRLEQARRQAGTSP